MFDWWCTRARIAGSIGDLIMTKVDVDMPMRSVNVAELRIATRSDWVLTFVLVAIALRVASAPTANFSYLLIAAYALLGRAQAIQALALSWLFTMLNPVLAPEASAASILRYVVIFAALLSVVLRSRGAIVNKMGFYTLLLGAFILIHSLLFSAVVDVSVLKVIVWVVVVATLLSAWQGLPNAQRMVLFEQLQWGLIGLLLLSLPLMAFPGIGYARNGTGFQGMLNHPQVFGPTVALVGALLGGKLLGIRKPTWRHLALFAMCMVLVVLSEARTAGLAMVLGLIGTVILSPLFAGMPRRQMLPGLRSRRFLLVALISLAGAILAGPILSDKLSGYLYKRSNATSLIDAADASRGRLLEKMIVNINESPWTGIGFGIASNPADMKVVRDPFLDLPISALAEKGVMPIAIVEELGVFGALVLLVWFLVVLRRGARSSVPQFAVLITLLLVNFGESMLFSAGGMGMLLLILLTGAVSVKGHEERVTSNA